MLRNKILNGVTVRGLSGLSQPEPAQEQLTAARTGPLPACQLSPSPQIAQAESRSKEGSLLTSSSDVTTEVSSNADQPVDEATATREQQEGAACRVQQKCRP